jgi:2-polyprenyl-3-methyl-5-hydroxy-6-metoxy-1,4-benzoquinol methylase
MEPQSVGRFTGERPGRGPTFAYDEARHLAAYRYAARLAAGKRVVDAGCGEGFGTQLLADVAASVVGLDYSAAAIAHCRTAWRHPNLTFQQSDLTRPGSVAGTFDLVLNFQVVEHIRDPLPFLRGLRALLAPAGQVLLTTPNRLMSFSENPYHIREYSAEELANLLAPVFGRVTILGMHGNATVREFDRRRAQAVGRILRLDPLGLRHRLPRTVVNFAFARLAVLVRRRAGGTAGAPTISPDDFHVSAEGLAEALDLVAQCEA